MTEQTIDRRADDAQAFREQCRRQMARPLEALMQYGWHWVSRPVFELPGTRNVSGNAANREWWAANLPAYLVLRPSLAQ